jgi:hypothetical protein
VIFSNGKIEINKNNMKTILLSSFLFLLAPCNSSKKAIATPADQSAADNTSDIVITYQKTVCFGKCPAFTLTINGDCKLATYKGEMNVDKIGEYEKKISDQELKDIVSAFEKYHFGNLKEAYKNDAMDHPSIFTTLKKGTKTKKVEDMYGAPNDLKAIEKVLDDFSNSEGWMKKETKEEK